MSSKPWLLVLILVLGVGVAPTVAAQDATPPAEPGPGARLFELAGDAIYPEGVVYDETTGTFFVSSTSNGAIFRGNYETGEVDILTPGADGRTAIGMALDDQGRLYVAGGQTGLVSVYDSASGELLATFTNGLAPETFLNDVAITPSGDVFVTDSFNPRLYRLPTGVLGTDQATPTSDGELVVAVDLAPTVFAFAEGFNANGIVVTPDGASLLVVQANTGNLYNIDVASGTVDVVDLGDGTLTGGDGMVLDGQTLYVVRSGEVTAVEMGADFATGTIIDSFDDPSFSSPTTAAKVDNCLLVVNSQFANRESGTPTLPFSVTALPIPESVLAFGVATPVVGIIDGAC